jgi:site-specific DNA-cytosine methylase
MRYVSLFSGIEAASEAWHSMGWDPVAFADIDKFPSAVLAHHFPDVPNMGNVEEVDWSEFRGKADLVVGGSPCQSFSVAGKRLGMDDPRGNLALEFLRAVKEIQPTWFLFENVPGLLSSDGGRDFGIFLGEVAKIGYGFAYRILDSQYFGVPQRRRRVFVVGHIGGDWRSAASVLFERESLQGHSKESKAQGKAITQYFGTSTSGQGEPGRRVVPKITGTIDTDCGGGKLSVQHASSGHLIPETEPIAQNWDGDDKTGTLTTRSMDQFMPDKDNFMAVVEPLHDPAPTLDASYYKGTGERAGIERQIIAESKVFDARGGGDGETTNTLASGRNAAGVSDFTPLAVESKIFDSKSPRENPKNISPTLNASTPYTSGDPIVTEPEIFDETNPNGKTDVSPTLNARDGGSTGDPIVYEYHGQDSRVREVDVASTLNTNGGDGREGHLVKEDVVHSFDSTFSANSNVFEDVSPTLKVGTNSGSGSPPAIAHKTIGFDWKNAAQTNFDEKHSGAPVTAEGGLAVGITAKGNGDVFENEIHTSLSTGGGMPGQGYPAIRQSMAVRRLTPLECERLQGFTDGYTQIAWRNKAPENCPDGPRYKALGNSMAVPVMRWIGEGIKIVDEMVENMTEREDSMTIVQKSIFDF